MRSAVIALCLMLPLAPASYAAAAAEEVEVVDPWVRVVPPGAPTSAAFMELRNGESSDHALVEVRGDVAKSIELHTHTNVDGVMQMRQVEQMVIPAGGVTKLAPMGLHIMLIGLQGPIAEGDRVQLQLVFEDGSATTIKATARSAGGMMHQHHHH